MPRHVRTGRGTWGATSICSQGRALQIHSVRCQDHQIEHASIPAPRTIWRIFWSEGIWRNFPNWELWSLKTLEPGNFGAWKLWSLGIFGGFLAADGFGGSQYISLRKYLEPPQLKTLEPVNYLEDFSPWTDLAESPELETLELEIRLEDFLLKCNLVTFPGSKIPQDRVDPNLYM